MIWSYSSDDIKHNEAIFLFCFFKYLEIALLFAVNAL